MEFLNQLPNFDVNIFDDEQNKRIDERFVPTTDSEVNNLMETEENAGNLKNRRFVQEIVVLRCGSRRNGDRFSIKEGAKAPPSNEGGQVRGHVTPEKRFGF